MSGFVHFEPAFDTPLFPYTRRYLTAQGARMAYVDEGPRDAPAILMLHGIPTWGFLYRNIVRTLSADHRCVVPDLPGFGMSDRIIDTSCYSLQWYIDTVIGFVEQLQLQEVTVIVHDLGGPVGLGFCAERPNLLRRLLILNTTNFPDAPLNWRVRFSLRPPLAELLFHRFNLLVNTWIPAEVHHRRQVLTEEVMAAYRAPFPDFKSRQAIAATSRLIPTGPGHPSVPRMERTNAALVQLEQPVLVMWGDRDRLLRPWRAHRFAEMFKNCVGEVHFQDSGHYIQEDKPDEISANVAALIREN